MRAFFDEFDSGPMLVATIITFIMTTVRLPTAVFALRTPHPGTRSPNPADCGVRVDLRNRL